MKAFLGALAGGLLTMWGLFAWVVIPHAAWWGTGWGPWIAGLIVGIGANIGITLCGGI